MNPDKHFTAEEQERIRRSVAAAESRTSGEIVPMIVGASDNYAEAGVTCLITGILLGSAAAFVWGDPWGLARAELAWPLCGAAFGLLLSYVPAVKRRLVPQTRIAEAVHVRCLAAFTAHGLHYTQAHTGILILASLFERRVEVLADRGINEKVPPGTWDGIVAIITTGLKSNDGCAAFVAAIEECGRILAAHFPRAPDDRNELEDKLVTEK
ncbi:MAG TPA: TPM domain-containing protein [Candidatus Binatia bacterium]